MEKLISEFSVGLFFWQSVLFLLLIFLLKKFAWKPILNAVNEREDGIKNALASAEEARKEMQNLHSDNERILKEARAQKEDILKDAREIKNNILSEAKEEASQQGQKIILQAIEEIEIEKQAAISKLKKQVAELSIGIAEKVIKKELNSDQKQLKLVESLLEEATLN